MTTTTKKQAWTPGPWYRNIKPATRYTTIFAGRAPNHSHICHLNVSGLTLEEVEGNCRLISKAPEMAAFLQKLVAEKPKRCPEWHEDTGHNLDDAESNGYDICAWKIAEEAERLLADLGAV